MRFFNTAGPVNTTFHYVVPPLSRIKLDEVLMLIDQKKYFILHAPRQVGKTSLLLALKDHINQEGKYFCLYINVEAAQAARENVDEVVHSILGEIVERATDEFDDSYPRQIWQQVLAEYSGHGALNALLTQWSRQNDKPIVLLIDEIDSLVGDGLISVLRQLRSGYDKRPSLFPQSIILCGVRDIKDYRIHASSEKSVITGGSAFNVKARSLRLGDFDRNDLTILYGQHTQETGQVFTTEAIDLAWELTCGQPWLANALGYEVCFEMHEGRDRTKPISKEMILAGKERLILRRETHLDQLTDKLQEERVRSVIEPILAGETQPERLKLDDLEYVRDLGLIRINGQIQIANPIYQEVIPRALTYTTQITISQQTTWYVLPDGRLDMHKLLAGFQEFFREHSEHWVERFDYKEAGPQLLMQAFLQRIINGGGRVEREYGLGRQRTDLFLVWPYSTGIQRVVIELKILHRSLEQTINDGLRQTKDYMDICATSDGHLIIFDRTADKPWDEKIFQRVENMGPIAITVWGM